MKFSSEVWESHQAQVEKPATLVIAVVALIPLFKFGASLLPFAAPSNNEWIDSRRSSQTPVDFVIQIFANTVLIVNVDPIMTVKLTLHLQRDASLILAQDYGRDPRL